ncbi:uncharacterized protein LOC125237225 isoform X2 [Leguminivora glycinivorella]|uniref:uncharacterized protein LOC125237225 isoform X2 n=1 Tax=Leguminivora glycinivorella TaxID=1035111 RepID=UPI00200D3D78|nr:uncharacterized protein LOC125237225 isoform X2 [Leguminivora glycinivorella]
MKTWTIAFVISTIICIANGYFTRPSRYRREVGGTLEIVSKNVQPIHADVKSEMTVTEQLTSGSTRCTFESPTETTEVVTPPATIFQQSLRKSLPVPSRLELIRSISRLAAVVALAFTALVELYPALAHLVNTLYSFIV